MGKGEERGRERKRERERERERETEREREREREKCRGMRYGRITTHKGLEPSTTGTHYKFRMEGVY